MDFEQEFNENGMNNLSKINDMFDIEKMKLITERIVNRDVVIINSLLHAEILYPKTLELLDKTLEYHKANENYEVCTPIYNLRMQILENQKLIGAIV